MRRLSVGYAKLGRSMQMDPRKFGMNGDCEAPYLVRSLAERNPDVDFYLIGKSNGFRAEDYPENIINPWECAANVSNVGWVYKDKGYRCSDCGTEAGIGAADEHFCCEKMTMRSSLHRYIKVLGANMDAFIIHVGQHSSTHRSMPLINGKNSGGEYTQPYVWARNYGDYLLNAVNAFQDAHPEPNAGRMSWLVPDPRNYIKARDVKWPSGTTAEEPVLAQYQFTRSGKHERFGDGRSPESLGFKAQNVTEDGIWVVEHHYNYSGFELIALPDDWESWGGRSFAERMPFGVASTGPWLPQRELRRSAMIQDWVLQAFPSADLHGKWNEKCYVDIVAEDVTVKVDPVADFPNLLGSWLCTVALPPITPNRKMQTWTTAKPMQAFAARTVCFFVPPLDAQGELIPNIEQDPDGFSHEVGPGLWSVRDDWTPDELAAARWLRPKTPRELQLRANALISDENTWQWLVNTQRNLVERRYNEHRMERLIEERLDRARMAGSAAQTAG